MPSAGDEDVVLLSDGLKNFPGLTSLDLSSNDIGLAGVNGTVALGEALRSLPNLTSLDLSSNDIGYTGDSGTIAIGEGLHFLPNLTSLDLSTSYIGYTGDAGTIAGTIAIGEGLSFLPHLTSLDLSLNFIGFTGDSGTVAIGEGLRNKTALTTLNLSDNFLGRSGSQGIETILQNVIREGLNLNLAGAVGIPWTTGAQALATLNAGPVAAACLQQRCFGNTPVQNTTTAQSVGARRVLAVEEVLVGEEDDMSVEELRPSFLTRWGQNARSLVTHVATSTKQTLRVSWDAFGDWLTKILTDAAHEVVTNSPSYFPNANNRHVRDWPIGGLFLNTTSAATPGPALPAVPFAALP